jgi:two-component system, chemotaxis family, response regulator Rcp1
MKNLIHILLVEDNPADADLTSETLISTDENIDLSIAKDGVEALELLHNDGSWSEPGRPTLILLDLNLPRKDGRQVLAVIKSHDLLRRIPVVVLSSSDSEKDVTSCYQLGANCYIAKPGDLQAYRAVVRSLKEFWIGKVTLPRRDGHSMDARIGTGL